MSESVHKVRMPIFPLYSRLRILLEILQGVPKEDVLRLIMTIRDQTGTPQNPVDWTDPDTWINERLSGIYADLAQLIWRKSKHSVNPRYIYGSYLMINSYELLIPDNNGIYQLSDKGRFFLDNDKNTVQLIDESEGLLQILSILSTKGKGKRADILPEWSEYLLEYSKFGTASTFNDTLRRRLSNLIERGFVEKEGNGYRISDVGQKYLDSSSLVAENPKRDVLKIVSRYNGDQRSALKEMLSKMHPYQFEHLIRDLLEAMGYEDVIVTKESGDKGVDVTGTIQFGITSVKEVVQVKRTPNSSVGRPLLDQLRGALVYHQAIQGTLITLGTVSKGAKEGAVFPGAAPITLIDGEHLLDLLIEHRIGIKKRSIEIWEVDHGFFDASNPELETENLTE